MQAYGRGMAQLTVRLDDVDAEDLRAEAARRGMSVNALAVTTLKVLLDPEHEGAEVARIHAKLRRAGLLAEPVPPVGPPVPDDEVEAARRAVGGRALASEYVVDGR